jgi:hypothetical protein
MGLLSPATPRRTIALIGPDLRKLGPAALAATLRPLKVNEIADLFQGVPPFHEELRKPQAQEYVGFALSRFPADFDTALAPVPSNLAGS